MNETATRSTRLDGAIALLLFAAAALYLAWLPWNLGWADESFFLYEARRIREGEVMYRDFFQFVAPGAWYFQALLYLVFGTSMATARISTAILHGATVVLLYAGARRLGVRRAIAVVPPVAYLAICQPAWGHASPHWYATFVATLLVYVALPGTWASRTRSSLALGALAGVLILVQQQKGVITAAGIGGLFFADAWLRRLLGDRQASGSIAQVAWFAAGVLALAGTALLAMIAAAGFQPVFDDLVLYPIREYRGATSARWGAVGPISGGHAAYTWPWLLRYLPLAALPAALRLGFSLIALVLPADASKARPLAGLASARRLLTMIAFLLCSVLSILYNPDFVHLAFIAPVALLLAAEAIEWALGYLGSSAIARAFGCVLAASALFALGQQLVENTARRRATFDVSHQTAFGRVDFNQAWEPMLIDRLRALLDATPGRQLFCYPFASSPYLTTGGRNPTPYQHLAPSQSPAWQVEQAAAIVRAKRVPYIVAAPVFLNPRDPIGRLIGEGYEYVPIGDADTPDKMPRLWLFARSDLVEAAAKHSTPPAR